MGFVVAKETVDGKQQWVLSYRPFTVGRQSECLYFRVKTSFATDKLFFDSKEDYDQWVFDGRPTPSDN